MKKQKFRYNRGMTDYEFSGMNKGKICNPFTELCRFTDEYGYTVEIEKPFVEFDEIFLKVLDSEGNEMKKTTLPDIYTIEKEAGKMLNSLSKCTK